MHHTEIAVQTGRVLEQYLQRIRENSSVCVLPRPDSYKNVSQGQHYHKHPEVMFPVAGCWQLHFSTSSYTLLPGTWCLIPAYFAHTGEILESAEAFRNLVIRFDSSTFSIHFAHPDPRGTVPEVGQEIFFHSPLQEEIVLFLRKIIAAGASEHPLKTDVITGAALLALSLLWDVVSDPQTHLSFKGRHQKVTLCRNFIKNNLSDSQLSVQRLARTIGCSPDYLSALFRKEMGISLSAYLNRERCQYADRLLADASLQIAEVAWTVGYADPGYFCRVFKKLFGQSPHAYRKEKYGKA